MCHIAWSQTAACKASTYRPREECLMHDIIIMSGWIGQQPYSLVLKSPLWVNSFSLPVNSDAGPLNSCLVLRRRLTSLRGGQISAFSKQGEPGEWYPHRCHRKVECNSIPRQLCIIDDYHWLCSREVLHQHQHLSYVFCHSRSLVEGAMNELLRATYMWKEGESMYLQLPPIHGEAAEVLPYLENLAILLSPLCVHYVHSLHADRTKGLDSSCCKKDSWPCAPWSFGLMMAAQPAKGPAGAKAAHVSAHLASSL